MSIPVFRAKEGSVLPLRPRGELLKGWLPGTVVNFIPSDDGHFMDCDVAAKYPHRSSNGGMFTINGSYFLKTGFDRRFANQNEPTGLWTPDEMIQWTKGDENFGIDFDMNGLVNRIGKDITTVNFDGGCFRVYTFERYDNEYLESNGASGGEINWRDHIGETLGTSPRSLFTTLQNNVIDDVPAYRVGNYAQDENGKWFIFIVRR